MVDFDDAGKKNWAEFVQAALTLKPGSARDTPERQHATGAASDHVKREIWFLVTQYINFTKVSPGFVG